MEVLNFGIFRRSNCARIVPPEGNICLIWISRGLIVIVAGQHVFFPSQLATTSQCPSLKRKNITIEITTLCKAHPAQFALVARGREELKLHQALVSFGWEMAGLDGGTKMGHIMAVIMAYQNIHQSCIDA